MKTFRNILFPACITIAGLVTGCSERLALKADLIQIEGVSWACNITTSYATFGSTIETEDKLEVDLPATEGDLLYMMMDDLQFYYRYHAEMGTHLEVIFDTLQTVTVHLNGRLDFMELSGPASLDAFDELTESEINQLSTLNIKGPITEDMLSTIRLHEASLSGKGIVLEGGSGSEGLSDLFSICTPGLLIIDDSRHLPKPGEHNLLADLELLWVEGDIPAFSNIAPFCYNLESLIISDWKPLPGELLTLSGLKKLKSLTVAESDLTSLSQIEFPASLRDLQLISCDTLFDIAKLDELKGLKRVCLTDCGNVLEPGVLKDMGALCWLSFPSNISHDDFGSITGTLNQLKVVELIDCNKIRNLASLQSLPKLQAALLHLDKEQLSMIDSLDQLELLVLTSELFEDNPQWIKDLRTTLPQCKIVPGSGICLGSGWLLLLLPFVFLFRYIFRHKS